MKLHSSKTRQVCKTSSKIRHWQRWKRSNSAGFLCKIANGVPSWRPRTNAFCDVSAPPVWSTATTMKKWGQVIWSAAPVTQNHLSKPTDLMLQSAAPLRKSAAQLPKVLRPPVAQHQILYPFAHFDLLSTDALFSDSLPSLIVLTSVAASVHKTEVWLRNFLRLYGLQLTPPTR